MLSLKESALSNVIVFVTSPSDLFVTLPVALTLLTSPSTKLVLSTYVTFGFVNAVPSYVLLPDSDFNLTTLFVIS